MAVSLKDVTQFLQKFAPLELAEDWDNVGLLVGDSGASLTKVMTCLTVTPDVVAEAIDEDVGLIVTHHPMLFRATQKITSGNVEGRMLLDLISHRVAVYSPHTAYDSAAFGINQSLCERLGLTGIQPLRPIESPSLPQGLGSGRYGQFEEAFPLQEVIEFVKSTLGIDLLQYVGDLDRTVHKVAVACGSAAEYLRDADQVGCDLLITGEGRFHSLLEARSTGIAMILAGHYATERPAVEDLAMILGNQFPGIEVFPSQSETDPLKWSVS